MHVDPLIPRSNPLGPGMGPVQRRERLPSLRYWRLEHGSRLANDSSPGRIRANHAIPGLQLPLLHRRAG